MIFIYNESNIQWKAKVMTPKTMYIGRHNSKSNKTTNDVALLCANTILTKEEREAISDVNNGEVVQISNRAQSLYFSDKKMEPFITTVKRDTPEREKRALLFLTISFKGRRFLDIGCKNVYILNHSLANGELSITAYYKTPAPLTIRLLNNETGMIEHHKFNYDGEEVSRTNTQCKYKPEIIENAPKPKRYFIERFIPRITTNLVMSYKGYSSILSEKIDNINKKKVVLYTMDSLEKDIETLKSNNYDAVTLYINTAHSSEALAKNRFVLRSLCNKFKVVNVLFVDKMVILYKKK